MNFTDEALRILSSKLYRQGSAITSRGEMEAMLLMMIRVALRTGLGRPEIVRWVKKTLPAMAPAARPGDQTDPEWAAPCMARLLCAQLLRHVRAEPTRREACETVVGL